MSGDVAQTASALVLGARGSQRGDGESALRSLEVFPASAYAMSIHLTAARADAMVLSGHRDRASVEIERMVGLIRTAGTCSVRNRRILEGYFGSAAEVSQILARSMR